MFFFQKEGNCMSEEKPVLEIENPHLTLKLYADLLKIDLKGNFKNELEEALENKPVLKGTIGGLLGIFVPLHIPVEHIKAVDTDENGNVIIDLGYHRSLTFQLERNHAEILVDKLRQKIQAAETRRIRENAQRRNKKRIKKGQRQTPASSYTTFSYYFPTEQVDIVNKLKQKKKIIKK
jgi:hypothetical protein